ncbi:unnamed protein product [Ambrosiozyma monospora]|uniref:Unnamed protein product n=1 Tax=Ambrosiozyma monospora TaxID=43982 RepID=A0ACB5SR79_AMBMO|nr:unnamed protein product [Ambrosiozyma monospora]
MNTNSNFTLKRRHQPSPQSVPKRPCIDQTHQVECLPVGIQESMQILKELPTEIVFEEYYCVLKQNFDRYADILKLDDDGMDADVFTMLLNDYPLRIGLWVCTIKVERNLCPNKYVGCSYRLP